MVTNVMKGYSKVRTFKYRLYRYFIALLTKSTITAGKYDFKGSVTFIWKNLFFWFFIAVALTING